MTCSEIAALAESIIEFCAQSEDGATKFYGTKSRMDTYEDVWVDGSSCVSMNNSHICLEFLANKQTLIVSDVNV
jgi:hypothetical protein